MPSRGRLCDSCAGLGLMIAALLSELQQSGHGSPSEGRLSRKSSPKLGWKSVVRGERSRLASEDSLLAQENMVLRKTVEFLHERIEKMERTDVTACAAAGQVV